MCDVRALKLRYVLAIIEVRSSFYGVWIKVMLNAVLPSLNTHLESRSTQRRGAVVRIDRCVSGSAVWLTC